MLELTRCLYKTPLPYLQNRVFTVKRISISADICPHEEHIYKAVFHAVHL